MFRYVLISSGNVIERFDADSGDAAITYCLKHYGNDWFKHYQLCTLVTLGA